jgi:hypothetical protein
MNTQITKKYALLLTVAVFFSASVIAGEKETPENNLKETSSVILDPFYSIDNPSEKVTLEFYDFKDNLVYKATLSKKNDVNAKLAKYLNESDYLANNSKTSYFRYNK